MNGSGSRLPFYVLQLLGVVCFVFFIGFWAVTGRVSTEFIAAAMALILGGSYGGLVNLQRNGRDGR